MCLATGSKPERDLGQPRLRHGRVTTALRGGLAPAPGGTGGGAYAKLAPRRRSARSGRGRHTCAGWLGKASLCRLVPSEAAQAAAHRRLASARQREPGCPYGLHCGQQLGDFLPENLVAREANVPQPVCKHAIMLHGPDSMAERLSAMSHHSTQHLPPSKNEKPST